MALEKQVIIGKIEILPNGQIQVRQDMIILENKIEISRMYHRMVISPGDTIPLWDDGRITSITKVLWTTDVVTAFKNNLIQQV